MAQTQIQTGNVLVEHVAIQVWNDRLVFRGVKGRDIVIATAIAAKMQVPSIQSKTELHFTQSIIIKPPTLENEPATDVFLRLLKSEFGHDLQKNVDAGVPSASRHGILIRVITIEDQRLSELNSNRVQIEQKDQKGFVYSSVITVAKTPTPDGCEMWKPTQMESIVIANDNCYASCTDSCYGEINTPCNMPTQCYIHKTKHCFGLAKESKIAKQETLQTKEKSNKKKDAKKQRGHPVRSSARLAARKH